MGLSAFNRLQPPSTALDGLRRASTGVDGLRGCCLSFAAVPLGGVGATSGDPGPRQVKGANTAKNLD